MAAAGPVSLKPGRAGVFMTLSDHLMHAESRPRDTSERGRIKHVYVTVFLPQHHSVSWAWWVEIIGHVFIIPGLFAATFVSRVTVPW